MGAATGYQHQAVRPSLIAGADSIGTGFPAVSSRCHKSACLSKACQTCPKLTGSNFGVQDSRSKNVPTPKLGGPTRLAKMPLEIGEGRKHPILKTEGYGLHPPSKEEKIMKLRVAIGAVLALLLAAPAIGSSGLFSDVSEEHVAAVNYVANSGLLPPDGRATAGKYGARYGVTHADISNAIKAFERMEGEYLRREEAASFLLAGIQKVRELRAADTSASPATTTARSSGITADLWWYRQGITCQNTWQGLQNAADDYETRWDFRPTYYENPHNRFDTATVLKVRDWYKRIVTYTYYSCQGEAELSDGRYVPIYINQNIDEDYDWFHGYSFPRANNKTCVSAKSEDLSVERYNSAYLYKASRDDDGDRIMCENLTNRRVGDTDDPVPWWVPSGSGL